MLNHLSNDKLKTITAKIDIQSKVRRLSFKKTQEKDNRQEVDQQERKKEKSDRSLEEIPYPTVRSQIQEDSA